MRMVFVWLRNVDIKWLCGYVERKARKDARCQSDMSHALYIYESIDCNEDWLELIQSTYKAKTKDSQIHQPTPYPPHFPIPTTPSNHPKTAWFNNTAAPT